jgi:SAM-dependent methyltransferase
MSLKHRSKDPELMDEEGDSIEIHGALKELRLINKYLGGNLASAKALKKIKRISGISRLNVLDAGSGASDILYDIPGLKLTALDKNKFICSVIKEKPGIDVACGDILNIPFSAGSFDTIHSSLFLHHFDDDKLAALLENFCSLSKYAVVINDLHRSRISYFGFIILSVLFSRNRLVKNDGPLSIKKGFRKKELTTLLDRTACRYELKWKWAFRWIIIIYVNERI